MIIGSMPHCYPVSSYRPCHFSQECISHLPGCFFQRSALLGLKGFYITPFYNSRDTELVGQVRNIPGISLRISTSQLVVKVSHVQLYVQLPLEFNQGMEQTD